MRSLYRIYHPEVFQGSLGNKNYFEGWYFKLVSADTGQACAIIAGVSLSEDPHSFVQYIDGNSGKTAYFRYSLDEFTFSRRKLEFRIGDSVFTDNGISLHLDNIDSGIAGELSFDSLTPLHKTISRPGIMGWYSFVPRMECNHGIVSVDHQLKGSIILNSQSTDFTGGRGYIEKDWGVSFPESWIWLQCNNFIKESASLMISIAKIPWRGNFFIGLISFIRINGKTEILATYNGARVERLGRNDETSTQVVIRRKSLVLRVIITKKGAGTLKAPSMGLMNSVIRESLNSEIEVEVSSGGDLIFSGRGVRAGYEETDRIFSYF